jgi:tubulin polyglutamylase TTLL6/13
MYSNGLARFATVQYEKPGEKNLDNLQMHLTNYAINKDSENFVQNTDKNNDYVGSKRSIQSVWDNISEEDGNEVYQKIKAGIYDIVIKSMCLSTPHVTHLIRSCHPDYDENQLCF